MVGSGSGSNEKQRQHSEEVHNQTYLQHGKEQMCAGLLSLAWYVKQQS